MPPAQVFDTSVEGHQDQTLVTKGSRFSLSPTMAMHVCSLKVRSFRAPRSSVDVRVHCLHVSGGSWAYVARHCERSHVPRPSRDHVGIPKSPPLKSSRLRGIIDIVVNVR